MNRTLLLGILALGVFGANGQNSGSAAAGSSGGAAQPVVPANPSTTPQPPTSIQPSMPGNRNQPPPATQNQDQSTSISVTTSNNASSGTTNQFSGGGTNQFGTNQPTSTPGATNRVYGTNTSGRFVTNGASQNDMRSQDHAFTQQDRVVLSKVREAVLPRIQVNGQNPPVHFSVSQGVVTLLGSVQTIQIRQQIEQIIIQTPGVVNVVDQLVVGGGGVGTIGTTSDQELLVRVRQAVLPQIQTAGAFAPAVDFSVNQGVVTVMGAMPTPEESQRVLTLVRQVPGVVQVTDQIRVNQSGSPAPAGTQGAPRR